MPKSKKDCDCPTCKRRCDEVNKLVKSLEEHPNIPTKVKPKKKWKKTLLWTTFVLIMLGVIAYMLVSDLTQDKSKLTSTIWKQLSGNWWWLIIACVAVFGTLLMTTLSSSVIMHFLSGKPRFKICAANTMIRKFYSNVTPLGSGGEPFEVHYLSQQKLPEGTAITLPVLSYAIDRFVFVTLSILAMILNACNVFGTNMKMTLVIYIFSIIGIVLNFAIPFMITVALLSKKACRKITRFTVKTAKFFKMTKNPDALYKNIIDKLEANINCMKLMLKRKRLLICALFFVGGTLLHASVGYFTIKAFGFTTEHGWGWGEVVIMNILIINAISFCPTPGGAGMAEISFFAVYDTFLRSTGVPSGTAASLVWRFISFYSIIIIGAVFVTWMKAKNIRMARAAEATKTLEDVTEPMPQKLAENEVLSCSPPELNSEENKE